MNFVIISPYFPNNFQKFADRLNKQGVTVLGVGMEPYDHLGSSLQGALTEYFRVNNLEDQEEVKRALAFLFWKHGPLDRIESHNEHWLDLDAELREQFNMTGVRPKDLIKTNFKSEMKKNFEKAGVPVVPGAVVKNHAELDKAIKKINFPVIAKPDSGVGTAGTYRLNTKEDVDHFKQKWKQKVPYFIEAFVDEAELVAYDGLLDKKGNVIFETSFVYSMPTLDILKDGAAFSFTVQKEIDPKLKEYGRAILKEFGMKERFFHIEFFKQANGDYVALEYNNRLAGGNAVDTYNTAYSIDLYDEYARMIVDKEFKGTDLPNQFAMYVARRDNATYKHSLAEARKHFGKNFRIHERTPTAFSDIMGNEFIIVTFDTEEEVKAGEEYLLALA